MSVILAADVGGTKTLVALFRRTAGGLEQIRDGLFVSGHYRSLEEILAGFLAGSPAAQLDAACIGIAGTVRQGVCAVTNLPWRCSEAALATTTGVAKVRLLNDIEAAAYGMLHLGKDEIATINPPALPQDTGNIAVLAAGTGLGEAILFWDGERYHPLASEGGHADFAPHSDDEIALLKSLRAKYGGHVSYERVLSGPGLVNIYAFLRSVRDLSEPEWLAKQLREDDPAAVVGRIGLAGDDPVCAEALEMFAHIYGVEAGNLALKCLAVGGVYLGGGIAPKLLSVLKSGSFIRGFTDKGRYQSLMEEIGVFVALNTRAPLIGAAHFALTL